MTNPVIDQIKSAIMATAQKYSYTQKHMKNLDQYIIYGYKYNKGAAIYDNIHSIVRIMSPSQFCIFPKEKCKSSQNDKCKPQEEILKNCENEGWKNLINPSTNLLFENEFSCLTGLIVLNTKCEEPSYRWQCQCITEIICNGEVLNSTVATGYGHLTGDTNSQITKEGQDCVIVDIEEDIDYKIKNDSESSQEKIDNQTIKELDTITDISELEKKLEVLQKENQELQEKIQKNTQASEKQSTRADTGAYLCTELENKLEKLQKENQELQEKNQEFAQISEEQSINFETIFKSYECFKIFELANLKICHGHTNEQIISQEKLNKYDGERIYLTSSPWHITIDQCITTLNDFLDVCIAEFKNKGFLACNNFETEELQGNLKQLGFNSHATTRFSSYKCFKEFENQNIKICQNTNQAVLPKDLNQCTSKDYCIAPSAWNITKPDCIQTYFDICLEDFKEKGFIPCNTLDADNSVPIGGIFKAEEFDL